MNKRFIKHILYQLKKDYGRRIDIYSIDKESLDLVSGTKTITKSKISIRQALVFSVAELVSFNKEHSYVVTNRNFTYGSYFDVDSRGIVIDWKDIPRNIELKESNIIVLNHDRYKIEKIMKDEGSYYSLVIKALKGQAPNEIQESSITSRFKIAQYVYLS